MWLQQGWNVSEWFDSILIPATLGGSLGEFAIREGGSSFFRIVSPIAPPRAPAQLNVNFEEPLILAVSWQDMSEDEDEFILERRTGSEAYVVVDRPPAGSVLTTDDEVVPGNTYHYRLTARNGVGSSASIESPAVTVPRPPTAPPSVLAAEVASGTIQIDWLPSAGANSYQVTRIGPDGDEDTITTEGFTGTSATDDELAPGQYVYYVEAINHGGASPPALSPAVDLPDPNWPAPSDLTLRVTSNGNVEAVWTDNTSDEVRFELWRAIGDGGFAFKENVPPAGGVGSRVSAVDDTVELGQRYRFKVRAIRSQSNSAFSPVAEITVPVTVCCGPSDLALRITSNGNVEAEWTDNSDDEDLFEMWRSTDGQSFSFKENVPYRSGSGSRTSAVDDTVEDNRTYWFKVRALRGGKPTAFSNASSIDVPSRAPASLSLRVTSNRNVEAEWTDHTGDEERFELWRSTDGSNFFLKENVPAQPGVGTRANAVDTTVALGHTYWYKVRAIRSGNPTGFSNTETITVPSTMAGGPTDLSLRITSTRNVEATWTDNSSDEDRFELYRSNNGTDFSLE
jgi:titin